MLDISMLPKIARSDTFLVNRAIGLRPILETSLTMDGDADPIPFNLGLTDAWPEGEAFHTLEVTCDFGSMFLQVSSDAVDTICDLLLDGWREESRTALPTVWRGIFAAESIIAQTPIAIEDFDVTASAAGPGDFASFLNVELTIGGSSHVIWVGLRIANPGALIRMLPTVPSSQPIMRDISIEAFPLATLRVVPVDTMSSLRTGDIVLFEGPTGTPPSSLRLGDGTTWTGILNFEGQFMVETLSGKDPLMEMQTTEQPDPEAEIEPAAPTPNAPASDGVTVPDKLAHLPVEVEIAFGRTSLRLSQVSSLGTGSVLDLNLDLAAPVEIRANNERVGHGRLVQIGDAVGVQISQWSDGWQPNG